MSLVDSQVCDACLGLREQPGEATTLSLPEATPSS